MSALIQWKRGLNAHLSPHFSTLELECHCDSDPKISTPCESQLIDNRLLNLLEDIRVEFGQPITLSCAYRCPAHNKNVGGVAKSQHLYGIAADIGTTHLSGEDRERLIAICERLVPGGLGIAETFIHVDVRDTKVQVKWVY